MAEFGDEGLAVRGEHKVDGGRRAVIWTGIGSSWAALMTGLVALSSEPRWSVGVG
jgi:hypothetical protein